MPDTTPPGHLEPKPCKECERLRAELASMKEENELLQLIVDAEPKRGTP